MSNEKRQQAKQAAMNKLFAKAKDKVSQKKQLNDLISCVASEDPKRTVSLLKEWIETKD